MSPAVEITFAEQVKAVGAEAAHKERQRGGKRLGSESRGNRSCCGHVGVGEVTGGRKERLAVRLRTDGHSTPAACRGSLAGSACREVQCYANAVRCGQPRRVGGAMMPASRL